MVEHSGQHSERRPDHAAFAAALSCVSADLTTLVDLGPDGLADCECEAALRSLETVARRVAALQHRMVGALTKRRTDRAVASATRDGASTGQAAGRARRSVEQFLTGELGVAPGDARRSTMDSQRRGSHQQLDRARDAGKLAPRQARQVAEFLDKIAMSPNVVMTDDEHSELESEVIDRASQLDPIALGRWIRGQLIELDPRRAEVDEADRRRRRTAAATVDDDGMWHLSAKLAGVDAGIAAQAIDLFRVPDPANTPEGQRRSSGQITADAFVQMCRTALEADTTGTRAGSRPHVIITIDYQTLLREQGVADIERIGPVPFREVRRLLAEAGVARLLTSPEGVPLEAGRRVRSVPAGLRRAIILRDQGCIARHCTIPARWCQVAHLAVPFRFDGALSMSNAALLCHHHHARFDHHGWKIVWNDQQPSLVPPQRTDAASADAVSAGTTGASTAGRSGRQPPDRRAASKPPSSDLESKSQPRTDEAPPSTSQTDAHPQLPLVASESTGAWSLARAGPNGSATRSLLPVRAQASVGAQASVVAQARHPVMVGRRPIDAPAVTSSKMWATTRGWIRRSFRYTAPTIRASGTNCSVRQARNSRSGTNGSAKCWSDKTPATISHANHVRDVSASTRGSA